MIVRMMIRCGTEERQTGLGVLVVVSNHLLSNGDSTFWSLKVDGE